MIRPHIFEMITEFAPKSDLPTFVSTESTDGKTARLANRFSRQRKIIAHRGFPPPSPRLERIFGHRRQARKAPRIRPRLAAARIAASRLCTGRTSRRGQKTHASYASSSSYSAGRASKVACLVAIQVCRWSHETHRPDAGDLSIASFTCGAVIGLVGAVRTIEGSVKSSADSKVALQVSPCLS
jgi:hypothetical protein